MLGLLRMRLDRTRSLIAIKLLHTAVWLFFVGCILLIPIAAAFRKLIWVEVLTGFMFLECGVLAVNRGRCPLTDVASRYTDNRAPNFDIYLPEWLARNNKAVFGTLFIADLFFLTWRFAG
jgi:hypothetical protein